MGAASGGWCHDIQITKHSNNSSSVQSWDARIMEVKSSLSVLSGIVGDAPVYPLVLWLPILALTPLCVLGVCDCPILDMFIVGVTAGIIPIKLHVFPVICCLLSRAFSYQHFKRIRGEIQAGSSESSRYTYMVYVYRYTCI